MPKHPKLYALLALSLIGTLAQTQTPNADEKIKQILTLADKDYGQYLASECTTCHQQDGSEKGLPSITNLPPTNFIQIMLEYRNKELDNIIMQNVAARLDDEQIASLAVYFESLPAAQ